MTDRVFKVSMFGGFTMTYGDENISFERNTVTKTNQLLQILFCAGSEGISREKLIVNLFGKDNITNPSNSLRITVFRLRKLFEEVMPGVNPVITENRVYYWNPDIETEIDVHKFKRLVALGDESLAAGKTALACDDYMEALNLYKGEFIPQLSDEEWAIVENISYKNEYSRILKNLVKYLSEKGDYETLYKYVSIAASIYPYEDWQVDQMDCLIALNRIDEATKVYDQTTKLFWGELGVAPSEALLERFKKMGNRFINSHGVADIAKGIEEQEEDNGAFFCSYLGFMESYRFIRRMIERTGQAAYLVLCTITDGKGNPMQVGEKQQELTDALICSIKKSLRKGDIYTQYSSNQIILLLMELTRENCDIVVKRIKSNFKVESLKKEVVFDIYSVSDAEVSKEEIRIKKRK